jgi:hypothetical protein
MALEKIGGLLTKIATTAQSSVANGGLKSLRYEETLPAKPPIPVTIVPPRAPPTDTHPALRRPPSSTEQQDISKRDSGLAPTESTAAREGSLTAGDENSLFSPTSSSLAHTNSAMTPEIPESLDLNKRDSSSTLSRWRRGSIKKENYPKTPQRQGNKTRGSDDDFSPITTPIPTDGQLELNFMDKISFSNRGSVLLSGKKVRKEHSREILTRRSVQQEVRRQVRIADTSESRQASNSMVISSNSKLLSEELELESQKVRSMYEIGQSMEWVNGRLPASFISTAMVEEETVDDESEQLVSFPLTWKAIDRVSLNGNGDTLKRNDGLRPNSSLTAGRASSIKTEHELAGGLEDWEDISGGDVDRYGFITVRKETTNRAGTPEPRSPQRISTVSSPL